MNINEEGKYYATMVRVSFEPSTRARTFMGSVKNKM